MIDIINKFENGKIYKIVCNITGKVYIGSTYKSVSKRKADHKYDYKRYNNGNYHYVKSFDIIAEGDYEFILIEEYPCENNKELHERERYWIENTENCINKNIPGRTSEEWRINNKDKLKEYQKKYNENNKEKIKEYQKEYYKKNKDKIKEYHKEYAKKNINKLKQYYKELYYNNKYKTYKINIL